MSDNNDHILLHLGVLGFGVSAVLSLQWAPAMQKQERAGVVRNAKLDGAIFYKSVKNLTRDFWAASSVSVLLAIGSDCDVSPLAFSVANTAPRGGGALGSDSSR